MNKFVMKEFSIDDELLGDILGVVVVDTEVDVGVNYDPTITINYTELDSEVVSDEDGVWSGVLLLNLHELLSIAKKWLIPKVKLYCMTYDNVGVTLSFKNKQDGRYRTLTSLDYDELDVVIEACRIVKKSLV